MNTYLVFLNVYLYKYQMLYLQQFYLVKRNLYDITEVYSEPSRTSKMELFAKTVNSLTILAKKAHLRGSIGF